MDMAMVRRIAGEGVSPFGERLDDVVAFCHDWGRETGDARYLLLGDLFARISSWWEEQGVASSLLDAVDQAMRDLLPAVLAEADPGDGSRMAGVLAERVEPLLVPTNVWARENPKKD